MKEKILSENGVKMGRNKGGIKGVTMEVLERERERLREKGSRLKMIIGGRHGAPWSKPLATVRSPWGTMVGSWCLLDTLFVCFARLARHEPYLSYTGRGTHYLKRSFKPKSVTMLLCAVGIDKRMDAIFVVNHKIVLLQPKIPPQKLILEVLRCHQLTP